MLRKIRKVLAVSAVSAILAALPFASFGASAAGDPTVTFTADKETVEPGDTVVLTVAVADSGDGWNSLQGTVTYDASQLTYQSSDPDSSSDVGDGTNAMVDVNASDPGSIVFGSINSEIVKDGAVLALTFTVNDGVQPADTLEATLAVDEWMRNDITSPDSWELVEVASVAPQTVTLTVKEDEPTPPEPTYTYGDVNEDDVVNGDDALQALQVSTNSLTVSENGKLAADVNGDSNVTGDDALMILQFTTHTLEKFPVEQQAA